MFWKVGIGEMAWVVGNGVYEMKLEAWLGGESGVGGRFVCTSCFEGQSVNAVLLL